MSIEREKVAAEIDAVVANMDVTDAMRMLRNLIVELVCSIREETLGDIQRTLNNLSADVLALTTRVALFDDTTRIIAAHSDRVAESVIAKLRDDAEAPGTGAPS